ncbi:alanyl-tRNA editing protein [Exiguobacterium flavidum]|uniref:alanyl-tRNA editing protein n=1 Tax=Exiguobacterium flavidum TaxID=2184695 RepID=UPI000DF832E7|nr:alanyl-tRNA editing protein [Exiguobacterium flavidum]
MRLDQLHPDVSSFETTVAGEKEQAGYWVALDETYFYPESGGQPADRGTLNGQQVLDVQQDGGIVWHKLEKALSGKVKGEIDRTTRVDHAAQHTAQHVISAILQDEFSIPTVSFRTGSAESTLDIDCPHWTEELEVRLMRRLREVIRENLPVTTRDYPEEEALALPLRKAPQVTGTIRVVQIGELDYSACGGSHLKSTAALGLVLLTGVEKVRGNVRLSYVAGERAYTLLDRERSALVAASRLLSSKKEEVPDAILALKQEVATLEGQVDILREQRVEQDVSRLMNEESVIQLHHANEDVAYSERLAKRLADAGKIALVWNEAALKLFVAGDSQLHLGKWAKANLSAFDGRGGGNERMAQAVFPSKEQGWSCASTWREELVK